MEAQPKVMLVANDRAVYVSNLPDGFLDEYGGAYEQLAAILGEQPQGYWVPGTATGKGVTMNSMNVYFSEPQLAAKTIANYGTNGFPLRNVSDRYHGQAQVTAGEGVLVPPENSLPVLLEIRYDYRHDRPRLYFIVRGRTVLQYKNELAPGERKNEVGMRFSFTGPVLDDAEDLYTVAQRSEPQWPSPFPYPTLYVVKQSCYYPPDWYNAARAVDPEALTASEEELRSKYASLSWEDITHGKIGGACMAHTDEKECAGDAGNCEWYPYRGEDRPGQIDPGSCCVPNATRRKQYTSCENMVHMLGGAMSEHGINWRHSSFPSQQAAQQFEKFLNIRGGESRGGASPGSGGVWLIGWRGC